MIEILYNIENFLQLLPIWLARAMAIFTVVPFLRRDLLGGSMAKMSMMLSLMVILIPIVIENMTSTQLDSYLVWMILFKEVMVGMVLGFFINIPFWAITAVGIIVDNQRGASFFTLQNEISQDDSTPIGNLMSVLFLVLFVVGGGWWVYLKTVYFSYVAWPVEEFWPTFDAVFIQYATDSFMGLFYLSCFLAAPAVVFMFFIEWGLALIGRFAPQLNVFILAMPLKSAGGFLILIYLIDSLIDYLVAELQGLDLVFSNMMR